MVAKVEPFWIRKTLDQLNQEEWESLCDGCGLCCLQKLEDEDDKSVYYTRIACKLLDLKTCQCTDYPNRRDFVPDCIQLTPGKADEFKWLPPTCGYRLVSEGKDLPLWHHLVCGDRDAVHHERISQSGRMLAEGSVSEDEWEDHDFSRRLIFSVHAVLMQTRPLWRASLLALGCVAGPKKVTSTHVVSAVHSSASKLAHHS